MTLRAECCKWGRKSKTSFVLEEFLRSVYIETDIFISSVVRLFLFSPGEALYTGLYPSATKAPLGKAIQVVKKRCSPCYALKFGFLFILLGFFFLLLVYKYLGKIQV